MGDLGIIVGKGFDFKLGGQEQISSGLKSRGYFVKEVDEAWPRNDYVYFNGKYVLEENGNSGNVFGNGGMVQKGEDFLLVSDAGFFYNDFKSKVQFNRLNIDKEYYEKSKNLILDKGKKQFNARIHIAPTGTFFNGKINNGDIDLFTLLLPKEKLLIFDTYFGKNANFHKDYNKISEKEGLKLIEYEGSQDNVWYPLNALVIPSRDKEVVVLDKNAKSLIKLLEKKNVNIIPVDIPQRDHPAGKINCQTNVFDLKDVQKIRGFF